jgi:hypothetical protein
MTVSLLFAAKPRRGKPRTALWVRFVLLLGLVPATVSAQPDTLALVRRSVELHAENAALEQTMAFREQVFLRDLEASGEARNEKQKVHDVFLVEGSPQRVLLVEDEEIQDQQAIQQSQDFLRRVREVRRAETPSQRGKRIDDYRRKLQEFHDAVAEIPEAFNFRFVGEEVVDGRICYRLQATPREGYQPRTRYGKIFTQTEGSIWIDKATGHWVRADAELKRTVNLGWIFIQIREGSRAMVEQRPFAGAGWLMSSLSYASHARIGLFLHYRREMSTVYWNYRPMSEELWNHVLSDDYPTGSLYPPSRDAR